MVISDCCIYSARCCFRMLRLSNCKVSRKSSKKFVTKTMILKDKLSWKVENFENIINTSYTKVCSAVLREDCDLQMKWIKEGDNFSIVVTSTVFMKIRNLKVIGDKGLFLQLKDGEFNTSAGRYETIYRVPFTEDILVKNFSKSVVVKIKFSVLGAKNF